MEFSLPSTAIGTAGAVVLLLITKLCKKVHMHLQANGVHINVNIESGDVDAEDAEGA